jgi:hypothetical protein
VRFALASLRFKRGERRRKVDGRQECDAFAVEDTKYQFGAVDNER